MTIFLYILLGLVAGTISGFLGIGGAVIMIPALVLGWGLSQHTAQGTTLALMVPPIGLLAAIRYYQSGNVNLKIAAFVCLGFVFGGLIGAIFAHQVSDAVLRKVFGVFLMALSVKLIFF